MTDRVIAACCHKCHKHIPHSQVTTCISVHLYNLLKDGPYDAEVNPVTNQPVLKDLLQKDAADLRRRLRLEHCGNVFHQTCEGRRPEASNDRKLYDRIERPSGDTEHVLRDLKHHLCGLCLEIIQPGDLSTKYTGELSGKLMHLLWFLAGRAVAGIT